MKRLDRVFRLHRSRSELFSKHKPGDVPYVASGLSDNGVMGWVRPMANDTVHQFRGIAVSAFGEATIQVPPFIGYGCAGTSIIALEPDTSNDCKPARLCCCLYQSWPTLAIFVVLACADIAIGQAFYSIYNTG